LSVIGFGETPASSAKMNQKTLLIDTGANINSATTYAGQMAVCTSTGSGFTVNIVYQRDATNSSWHKVGYLNPATGDLLYWNGTDWTRLAIGSTAQVMTVSGGLPSWATPAVTSLDNTTVQANSGVLSQKSGFVYAPVSGSAGFSVVQVATLNLPNASVWGTTPGIKFIATVQLQSIDGGPANPPYIGVQAQNIISGPAQFDYGWAITLVRAQSNGVAENISTTYNTHNADLVMAVGTPYGWNGTAILTGIIQGYTGGTPSLVIYINGGNAGATLVAAGNFYGFW